MSHDWDTTQIHHDLPPEVWAYIKDKGFLGMIIPKRYGGKEFSAYAHSMVVQKLSTRCSAAGSVRHGAQLARPGRTAAALRHRRAEEHYLPRLARARRFPCLRADQPAGRLRRGLDPRPRHRLQGPVAGREVSACASPGTSATSRSGPSARCSASPSACTTRTICSAVTRSTSASPARWSRRSHPGVNIGRRHFPLNAVFQNGPNSGKDVFMPLDWIIGGPAMAGQGWRMLMECLAAGRSISLPSSNTGMAKLAVRAGRRLRPRAQPVQDRHRPLRGHRGAAGAHRRQHLHDGRRAHHDRRRHRPRREALGGLGHRQVPRHRARAPGGQRRHGHPRRQGHLPRPQQLPRPRLPADAGRRSRSRAPTS
jgi:acyl-CoA dehydrogenase